MRSLLNPFSRPSPCENSASRSRVQPLTTRPADKSTSGIAESTSEIVTSSAHGPVVLVLTTIAADADGTALARTLIDERLAACVNILPAMTSVYRWKGVVEQDREQQLVIKTTADRLAALEARIRELHSYELPEFLVMTVDEGSSAYLAWVDDAVR